MEALIVLVPALVVALGILAIDALLMRHPREVERLRPVGGRIDRRRAAEWADATNG